MTSPIARAAPPAQGIAKLVAVTGRRRTVWRTQAGISLRGTSSSGRPRFSTTSGTNRSRSGRTSRSASVARGDRAEPVEAVPERGMPRRHHDRVRRRDAGRDRVAHHAVHVPAVDDVLRVAVVRAERDATRAVLADERKQRLEVPRHRRLADEQPHPRAEALATLLDRECLVIRADPGGGVRLQLLPEDARRMPVDVLGALERELRELARLTGDHAREVHHLGETEHPAPTHERLEVSGRERTPRRLERRGRDAGRRHEVDVELEPLRGVVQPVHAVGAEHVRDLVRVGDDRGRPERQHEPRELVDEELHRLDVHVRVDEARDDEAPGRVDRLLPLVVPETGDRAVDDRHVDVEPLAREDREHLPAAHDEVGRLVTAGDGEAPLQVAHRADASTRVPGRVLTCPSRDTRRRRRASCRSRCGRRPRGGTPPQRRSRSRRSLGATAPAARTCPPSS